MLGSRPRSHGCSTSAPGGDVPFTPFALNSFRFADGEAEVIIDLQKLPQAARACPATRLNGRPLPRMRYPQPLAQQRQVVQVDQQDPRLRFHSGVPEEVRARRGLPVQPILLTKDAKTGSRKPRPAA